VEWIDRQLEARQLPRKVLADAIPGMTEVKLSLSMSGRRRFTVDEADAIRRFFGYSLPDDPKDPDQALIDDCLAKLGASQRRAVGLYLKALLGDDPEQHEAS